MSNVQVVNLADNINAAILKINQNFAGVDAGDIGGGLDSAEVRALITGSDLDMGGNKVLFGNVYSTESDLPNAGTYHGMFAHVHSTGKAYFAHAGQWVEIGGSNVSTEDVTNIVNNILDSDYFLSVINEEYLQQFTINTDVSYLDSDISANTSAILQLTSQINDSDNGLLALSQAQSATQAQVDGLVLDGFDSDALVSAVTSANSQVVSRIEANENELSVMSGVIDSVESQLLIIDNDLGLRIDAEATARGELSSTVSSQGGKITTLSQDVTTLDGAVFIRDPETGEITSNAITSAVSDLRTEIVQDGGLIQSALSEERTSITAEIDGDIATLNNELRTYVDAQTGGTVAQWKLDLTAGDTANPYVAGLEFTNDGSTADFVLSADTFKLVTPTDADGTGGISPFTVTADGVELSNAKVTGEIDVITSDSNGSMNIKGNLITISDDSGTPRVKLGDLSA